jgi:hypothetical protein
MSDIWLAIRDFASDFLDAILDIIKTVIAWFLDIFLGLIATAIESIDPPDFIQNPATETIPVDVLYFLHVTGFHDCLAAISAGIIFYFLRRVFTLGIW